MIRYKYNPSRKGDALPKPELGATIYVGERPGKVIPHPNGGGETDVCVGFVGGMQASIPVAQLDVCDEDSRRRAYDPERVRRFVRDLCGPLETSINNPQNQINTRFGDLLQFLYCLLETHVSIALPHIKQKIELFKGLGAWERANVMYALQEPMRRRIVFAANYWANMGRQLDEEKEQDE